MGNGRRRHNVLMTAATSMGIVCLITVIYVVSNSAGPSTNLATNAHVQHAEYGGGTNSEGCKLKFVEYQPSPWESRWTANAKAWGSTQEALCEHMVADKALADTWAEGAAASLQGCGQLDSRLQEHSEVFSRYLYEDTCTGETVTTFIEPLAGLTRHPWAVCLDSNGNKAHSKSYLTDRSYLVLGQTSPTCTHKANAELASDPASIFHGHGARHLLFDMGASLYKSGPGGASQDWFVDSYAQLGFPVTEYYGWEAKVLDPVKVWSQVPPNLKPHYHWLNVPANPGKDSPDNPWNFIKAVATPEDFVVVKLDIDTTPVEEQFMLQLLADADLRALIDEMHFEHHVNTPAMYKWWKKSGTQNEKHTLQDTYDWFGQLRRSGIRFHGWP